MNIDDKTHDSRTKQYYFDNIPRWADVIIRRVSAQPDRYFYAKKSELNGKTIYTNNNGIRFIMSNEYDPDIHMYYHIIETEDFSLDDEYIIKEFVADCSNCEVGCSKHNFQTIISRVDGVLKCYDKYECGDIVVTKEQELFNRAFASVKINLIRTVMDSGNIAKSMYTITNKI